MTLFEVNSGDTAWILTSAALVLLMTPGLALFYGGMVRAKSVLNMMMMSFGALALVPVLWVLYGYSMSFGNDIGGGLLGNPAEFIGLKGLMTEDPAASLPTMAFVAFQAVFAIITVALISGAIADRAKFGTWMIFVAIWVTVVYFPIAHWVFDFTLTDDNDVVTHTGGWIANNLAAIDFAGGTAVHINAGSALTAGNTASVVWVNTLVATGAASLGWLLTERLRDGHATSLGAASGVVAGLVAITPACSSVSPIGAIILGAIAGVLCALAVGLKYRFGYDDSLDVVGVHLVGGLWGTLAIGLLATADAPAGVDGLLYGGGLDQLWRQAVGAIAVAVTSFVLTYIIGLLLQKTIGFRVSQEDEMSGVDGSEHAESAYDLGTLGAGLGGLAASGSSMARPGSTSTKNTSAHTDEEVTA
jgi:Amt family ammonium transporter